MEEHQYSRQEILHLWSQIIHLTGVYKFSRAEWKEHYKDFLRSMLCPNQPYVRIDSYETLMSRQRAMNGDPSEPQVTSSIGAAAASTSKKSSKKSKKKKSKKSKKSKRERKRAEGPVITISSSSDDESVKAFGGPSDNCTVSGSIMSPIIIDSSDSEQQAVQRNANKKSRKKKKLASKRKSKCEGRAYAKRQKQDGPSTSGASRMNWKLYEQMLLECMSTDDEEETPTYSGVENKVASPNDGMDQEKMETTEKKNPVDSSDDDFDFECDDVFNYIDTFGQ